MWSFLGGLVGGLFKAMFGWFTDRQKRADEIELGQERQRAKTLEVDAAARKRVQQAEAQPRGDAEVEKDLDRGTF